MSSVRTTFRHPGNRLALMLWQLALAPAGTLPKPTVERVNALKLLAASWLAEDAEEASNAP